MADPTQLDQLKTIIDSQLNTSFWWILGFGAVLFLKNAVENFVWALTFLLDKEFCVDDEVLIYGTRKGRIVRQTMTKTVFYMYDTNTKLVILNRDFYNLRCEKVLPQTNEG